MKHIYKFAFILTVIVLTAVCVLLVGSDNSPESIFTANDSIAEKVSSEVYSSAEVTSMMSKDFNPSESSDEIEEKTEVVTESVFSSQPDDYKETEEFSTAYEEVTESYDIQEEITEAVTEAQTSSENDEEPTASEAVDIEYIEIERPRENSYAPGSVHEIVKELSLFGENRGSLEYESAVNTYTFRVDERGRLSYTVSHGENIATGWCVTLYQEYFINGVDGEKGYREINVLNTTSSTTSDRSVEIGLMAGNYRLVVTKGIGYTDKEYSITVDITEDTGYEIESNDNIYRYTEIYSGVPLKGTASYFNDRQDEDYYMFRMFNDGYAELKFAFPADDSKTSVCWQVFFYTEDGETVYAGDYRFSDGTGESGPIGLPKGNYFVVVRNRVYTDTTYTLTVRRITGNSFESENNDTKENANILELNSTISATITNIKNSFDKDWFRFVVNERGYCSVEFAHEAIEDSDGKAGWNITLTDESGETLYDNVSLWASDVISSPDIGLGAGVYYIRIDPDGLYQNDKTYHLSLNFVPSDKFETESNNNFEKADELTQGSALTGCIATVGSEHEYDYYTFTVAEKSTVKISFYHEKVTSNKDIFEITLYDGNKNKVGNSVKIKADLEQLDAQFTLESGKYYIRVGTGLFASDISYKISYNI